MKQHVASEQTLAPKAERDDYKKLVRRVVPAWAAQQDGRKFAGRALRQMLAVLEGTLL